MNQAKGFIMESNGKLNEVKGDSHHFQQGEMSTTEKQMIMMIVKEGNVPRDENWFECIEYMQGADGVTYCDLTTYAREHNLVKEYLQAAYPFQPVPKLDDVLFDIHSGTTFKVRNCRFIWYAERVMAVSPEFYRSGGTVLDWVEPERVDGKGRIVSMQEVKKEA